MNKKKIIYFVLTLLCFLLIFYFSSKTGKESNSTSKALINNIINIYESISNIDLDNENIIKLLNYPVRKLAHFTIFLIFGVFSSLFIKSTNLNKKIKISLIICLFVAIFDEAHQLFSMNRTSKLLDILIDFLGSCTGIFLVKKIELKLSEKK